MFVQPALYPVDFSILPPRPAGKKKKKVMEMEMEMEKEKKQQQQEQHLKKHNDNNNEQCNKKIYNNEKRPEKEMTIMVRILTTTTIDDDDEKKKREKTKKNTKTEKEKEKERPIWTLKWFTHQRQHRHRIPPAAQATVCYVPPPHPPRQQKVFHDCTPSITTHADISNLTPFFRKIAGFLNLLDHMILWSLWFLFLLGRIRR